MAKFLNTNLLVVYKPHIWLHTTHIYVHIYHVILLEHTESRTNRDFSTTHHPNRMVTSCTYTAHMAIAVYEMMPAQTQVKDHTHQEVR